MTYLKQTNVSVKRGRITTLSISIIFFIFFAVHYFFPGFYTRMLYPVATIFWTSESGVIGFFSDMAKIAVSKYSLVKENERLSQEVFSRDASSLLLDSLKEENEHLKNVLHRTTKGNDVLGVVLSRPPVSLYDTLIIDIGENDGVLLGNKVYSEGDILIGDIVEVYPHQSKVALFSMPGRSISVTVGDTGISAQALGRGLGNFSIHIPVEVGIKEGDTILLPQIRPHVFGIVEKILVDSSDSLQTVLFKLPVNMNNIRFVEVDIHSKQ